MSHDTEELDPRDHVRGELRRRSLEPALRTELYDEVRVALGLQPMAEAVAAGQQISQNVRSTLED